jgi:propionyl-CoA carboxylase beta chain
MRTDVNLAYPTAEIAVMGSEGAVNILYRKELSASKDAEKLRQEKTDEFQEKFANPYIAAQLGFIDEIIEPQFTRPRLISALRMLNTKRDSNPSKKHGNIPL